MKLQWPTLDSWYAAYSVGRGEKLYLAPEARVRSW